MGDIRASAETLAMLLQAIGHEVSLAHDGSTAVDCIVNSSPEIVFLDIAMPNMSGYEVAKRVRASTAIEQPMLVALTGYGQQEDRRRTSEAGFDHHLTKPTSLAALQDLLAIRRRPAGAKTGPLRDG